MQGKAFQKAFSTALAFKNRIAHHAPSMSNLVVVNVWSPGYYQHFPIGEAGARLSHKIEGVKEQRVFVKTSTERALAIISAKSKKMVKMASLSALEEIEDVSPGHASIEVGNLYLSIGARGAIEAVKPIKKYPIGYSSSYEGDVIAFKRPPEYRYPLFMLDAKAVSNFIREFLSDIKAGKRQYSLLGLRMLDFSEVLDGADKKSWYELLFLLFTKPEVMSDSCSSAIALALASGGAFNYLSFEDRELLKYWVLTPMTIERVACNLKTYEQTVIGEAIKPLLREFDEKSDKQHRAIAEFMRERLKDGFAPTTDYAPILKP